MTAVTHRQRITSTRRVYNRLVADETLEDYALRFTAKKARVQSGVRIAHTVSGSVSFLALEAIGGTLVLAVGFTNTVAAVVVAACIIFATTAPITVQAARHGVDIDLLTRGAGFGYLGSTVTSLIYATFTFLFLAIEAAIMALALQLGLGLPLWLGYIVAVGVVIPLVGYGVRLIGTFQVWTQPLWIVLNLIPILGVAWSSTAPLEAWVGYPGVAPDQYGFDLARFGVATGILFSLFAQVGEQVDFLRFMPERRDARDLRWWSVVLGAGAGWIFPGMLKILLGSFLTVLAINLGVPAEHAAEPAQMYMTAFTTVLSSHDGALLLTCLFIVVSQLKINVMNAYAGSIAWSNFFARLTHSHPGRVVWLVFNAVIALLLMELGIDKTIASTLTVYAIIVSAWIGALAADLAVSKPLGLSPPGIEFKRAHLYAVNPVGIGAMALALSAGALANFGLFGATIHAFAPHLTFVVAFTAAPVLAWATKGRFYLARTARTDWGGRSEITCTVCDLPFEPEDMAQCPAYDGPICSLCCTLEVRCGDLCKPHGRFDAQTQAAIMRLSNPSLATWIFTPLGRYLVLMLMLVGLIAAIPTAVYSNLPVVQPEYREVVRTALASIFFILLLIIGVVAWLFVLALESRRVADEEVIRQTGLYEAELEAHRITDAKLQRAKKAAEEANVAKSRYLVGISHELRTPLNAVLGYAQLMENDPAFPAERRNGVRVIRRSALHLSELIDSLLDMSRMEVGRLELARSEVRFADFLEQIIDMIRPQAEAAGLAFFHTPPRNVPAFVMTDAKRLRQLLLNLLSNAVKYTVEGGVSFDVTYHHGYATFAITDTGIGIAEADRQRLFAPFERGKDPTSQRSPGTGLGLTISSMLAQAMRGDLTMNSVVGQGTQFRVRLPLPEAVDVSTAPAAAIPLAPDSALGQILSSRAKQVVLVVDDDDAHRALICDLLQPLGLTVIEAPDGPTCLTRVAITPPDLIVLDIAMPGTDGWSVARNLRAAGETMKIVVMSAGLQDITPSAEQHGLCDAMFAKPFDQHEFLGQIRALLGLAPAADPVSALQFAGLPLPVIQKEATYAAATLQGEHLTELLRLARTGRIRMVDAKLAELAEAQAVPPPFVEHMRALLETYDLRLCITALEKLIGEAAI